MENSNIVCVIGSFLWVGSNTGDIQFVMLESEFNHLLFNYPLNSISETEYLTVSGMYMKVITYNKAGKELSRKFVLNRELFRFINKEYYDECLMDDETEIVFEKIIKN